MKRCLQTLSYSLNSPSQRASIQIVKHHPRSFNSPNSPDNSHSPRAEVATQNPLVTERLRELQTPAAGLYPRLQYQGKTTTCQAFVKHYTELLKPSQQSVDGEEVVLNGRVSSFRVAGSKLVFIDVVQEGTRVQALGNFRLLVQAGVTIKDFKSCYHKVRRGDIIRIKGYPHRSTSGELSLLLSELPTLLAPCLHPLPTALQDKETRIRNRHTDFLVNPKSADLIRLKSAIIHYLRQFLIRDQHVEIQTPILALGAGGAVARPFLTTATEFPNRNISLRIAPELWLKRMVIGGFDRVFEIGPSFRNEGLDLTHNPEFTTCEFYRAYTDLEELMRITEEMFCGLAEHVHHLAKTTLTSLKLPTVDFKAPFHRIDFIPALEAAISRKLPDLSLLDAESKVSQIFNDHSIKLPESATLPQLLDKLCAIHLEPQCTSPTFIVNIPECLSPLSKSFHHPTTRQRVSARAELFVNSREIVNLYEEENSPFEQRRKFIDQVKHLVDDEESKIDESYLEALEWGLPPTGGWGCGIERLCMLLSGADSIRDVLAFGSLRNVAALGDQGASCKVLQAA